MAFARNKKKDFPVYTTTPLNILHLTPQLNTNQDSKYNIHHNLPLKFLTLDLIFIVVEIHEIPTCKCPTLEKEERINHFCRLCGDRV